MILELIHAIVNIQKFDFRDQVTYYLVDVSVGIVEGTKTVHNVILPVPPVYIPVGKCVCAVTHPLIVFVLALQNTIENVKIGNMQLRGRGLQNTQNWSKSKELKEMCRNWSGGENKHKYEHQK